MPRYIDADALLKGIPQKYVGFRYLVTNAPTADVVEVVRCKGCKHRDPEDKMCDCGHFIRWQLPRQDDWFCADGERREDG